MLVKYLQAEHLENFAKFFARKVEDEIIVLGKGAHTPECSPEFIRPQIIESLERLQINKIDLNCVAKMQH